MRPSKRVVPALLLAALLIAASAFPASAQGALQGLPHRTTPEAPVSTGAHGRFSKAPINLNPPDLGLTAALLSAGGGQPGFEAETLVAHLTGSAPAAQTELAALTKKFGADKVASFAKTFRFVMSDALDHGAKDGLILPSTPTPDPNDSKALSTALYAAGTLPNGKYDAEYMLDSLVSHIVHVAVMNDIDANSDYGPRADADYHLVLAQLMPDVKKLLGF